MTRALLSLLCSEKLQRWQISTLLSPLSLNSKIGSVSWFFSSLSLSLSALSFVIWYLPIFVFIPNQAELCLETKESSLACTCQNKIKIPHPALNIKGKCTLSGSMKNASCLWCIKQASPFSCFFKLWMHCFVSKLVKTSTTMPGLVCVPCEHGLGAVATSAHSLIISANHLTKLPWANFPMCWQENPLWSIFCAFIWTSAALGLGKMNAIFLKAQPKRIITITGWCNLKILMDCFNKPHQAVIFHRVDEPLSVNQKEVLVNELSVMRCFVSTWEE